MPAGYGYQNNLPHEPCSHRCSLLTGSGGCLCVRRARLDDLRRLIAYERSGLATLYVRITYLREQMKPKAEALLALANTTARRMEDLVAIRSIANDRAERALLARSTTLSFRRLRILSELVRILPITCGPEEDRRHQLRVAAAGKTGLVGKALSAAKTAANVAAQAANMVGGGAQRRAWYVRGVHMPTSQVAYIAQNDECDEVATALGYIVMLVLMISKHLAIPLRYRLVYRGARSSVCDDMVYTQAFPLFLTKAADAPKFEQALDFLQRNIRYLIACRIPHWHQLDLEPNNALQNLHVLLMHEVPVD